MKTTSKLAFVLTMAFAAAVVARADDKKEVTLKGTITCAKCDLKETPKCVNVIKVKEDGKDVLYYFDDAGPKSDYHKEVCTEAKKGSVKGVVATKDGKKWIKPAKDGVKFEE